MWISSSSIKNRVSDRGRIDIFYRGSISGWKGSLLLLALASFFVSAAGDKCELLKDGTCVAKKSDDLDDGQQKYIGIDGDKITWNAAEALPIELYSQDCGKLSFIMSQPKENLGDDCKFSMRYIGCDMEIVWTNEALKFRDSAKSGGGQATIPFPGLKVNVYLEGDDLTCDSGKNNCGQRVDSKFCPFKRQKEGDWCSFEFAFKKTGSCNGEIQFGKDYKLGFPVPTTAAPETTPTTGAGAAGLSPWIIVAIVVGVLIFVAAGVGLIVFLICRRKRGSAQNMAEKGTVGSNYQCETVVPPTKSTLCADQPYQSESAASSVHSKKDRKVEDERSKPTSQVEVAKTVSQKNAKNVPDPSPSPLPEENKPKRILTPDELYEPLGDPAKAIPMHLSEKKVSEKKKGHGMNFANRKFGKKLPQT